MDRFWEWTNMSRVQLVLVNSLQPNLESESDLFRPWQDTRNRIYCLNGHILERNGLNNICSTSLPGQSPFP